MDLKLFFSDVRSQAAPVPKVEKPNHATVTHEKLVPLICEIDDALGTACAFGRAIELMALGFEDLKDDYGVALMTVTENLLRQVENARGSCSKLRSEIAP